MGEQMMPRQAKWDERFLKLAKHISTWSKDPSTKVGAIIVDHKGVIIGTGYNGFPRGVFDKEELYADREQKYKRVVHAELNAILNSSIKIPKMCTLYVTPIPPCTECTKAIIQSGIWRVVVGLGSNFCDKWKEEEKVGQEMLQEAGISRSVYPHTGEVAACLLGSNIQPAEFENMVGNRVTLGDVVGEACERSGLTTLAWNRMVIDDSDYAEALIQMAVDDLHLTPVE